MERWYGNLLLITKFYNEKKLENKSDARIEKKIHSKKVDNKDRNILGKSLQGHSPIYE